MNEDFFLATNGQGNGTRIETLPAGQNLGELQDLDYFYRKMWRGLRIPRSYMDDSAEGSSIANDGKVGIAYQQEIKFSLYIERLQRAMEKTLDAEFKRYLRDMHINVDVTGFEVILPAPSSYKESRESSIAAEMLNNYTTAIADETMSIRKAQIKYLGWSQDDVLENERLKAEERGLPPDGPKHYALIYNPEVAEQRGFDGAMGGGAGGGGGDFFADDDAGGDADGADLDAEGGDTGADAGAGKKPDSKAPSDK
jgi:hypothetical protein